MNTVYQKWQKSLKTFLNLKEKTNTGEIKSYNSTWSQS